MAAMTKEEFWAPSLDAAQRWLAWERMTISERSAVRNMSSIIGHPLAGFQGDRVAFTVRYESGETEEWRGWVGRSTGYMPRLLIMHNTRSTGGDPAPRKEIIVPGSIRLLRKGPR